MLLYFLYVLLSPVLWGLLPLIALFHPKARHHLLNQKKSIKNALSIYNENRKKVVLVHAASKGEYEQIIPLLRLIDRDKYFLLLTFSSPTLYEEALKNELTDAACYHPLDFPWAARSFFVKMDFEYYIITRNDLWPHHIISAKKMNILTVLVNANFYREGHYSPGLAGYFFSYLLKYFDQITTSSNRLKDNLSNITTPEKISVTGDSRLDRVLERKKDNSGGQLSESFKESHTIILGSVIPSDYPILLKGLKKAFPEGDKTMREKNIKLIVVPHETDHSTVSQLNSILKKNNFFPDFYSEGMNRPECISLIIDTVGILPELYAYSDLAYIGAGFGAGVHSVIEPAVYYNIISHGPNYQIVDFAVELQHANLSYHIESGDEFFRFLTLLDNKDELRSRKNEMASFVNTQEGAAENICKVLFND
ncbi:MAG: glycosyltransferase N-terminal domain-containing protein [Candidatus Marinimicrobia bacterium]|jgi:3-deoxy-D-manno-octulosonic-acid transferase|nr:glycosyltransferase N-terminal domain-containing protein [Candidatus Neomarinimicrobiota bacterium]